MVRRSSEASDDDTATCVNIDIIISGGGTDPLRPWGQEDEEGEEIQGVVREFEAQEGEEDRANQRQGRGPQVHSLASPFQAHLTHSPSFWLSLPLSVVVVGFGVQGLRFNVHKIL